MRNKGVEIREIRLRLNIAENDLNHKVILASKLLEEGAKVRVVIIFRGRESPHQQLGLAILQSVSKRLSGVGQVEVQPKVDRQRLAMVMSPRGAGPTEQAPVGAKPKSGPPTLSAAAEADIPKERR